MPAWARMSAACGSLSVAPGVCAAFTAKCIQAAIAVAMAGDGKCWAIRSRKGASRRCGSFCEPSQAIWAVRCLSAGLRKRRPGLFDADRPGSTPCGACRTARFFLPRGVEKVGDEREVHGLGYRLAAGELAG